MKVYLGHVGETAHIMVIGASVPCRVTSVGRWLGANAEVTATVTAKRAAGGLLYAPGDDVTMHGATVRPRAVEGTGTGWVWCDGSGHAPRCMECGDVHTVMDGIPGRTMGGIWVPGGRLVRCRMCGRYQRYERGRSPGDA